MDARDEAARERARGAKPQLGKPVGGAVGPACLTRIYTAPDTGETVVVVRGEIDIACEAALQKSLAQTLSCSAQGIEIDLSNVSFWAFSSVRVLLALRQLALREGKSVSLRAISPIVRRVLELSDTLCLFTTRAAPAPPTPPAGRRPPPTALSA